MSAQINELLESYHICFSSFYSNNELFKKAFIDIMVGNSGNNEVKTYGEIMTNAFDFIEGIERNLDLWYYSMSKFYVLEKTKNGYEATKPYVELPLTTFSDNNLATLINEGIKELYTPLLKICWSFSKTFRKQGVNEDYQDYYKFHKEFSAAFEAIRGIEKNILGLIKVLSF